MKHPFFSGKSSEAKTPTTSLIPLSVALPLAEPTTSVETRTPNHHYQPLPQAPEAVAGDEGAKPPRSPSPGGKAKAPVGTLVIPKSRIEGSAHRPAPKASAKRPPLLSVRPQSAKQRAAIIERAAKAGVSVNQFLLIQALGPDQVSVRLSKNDRVERAGALRAYRGTGNLLNQIAKHLHTGRIIGVADIEGAIKRHEANGSRMLAAFIKGLPP